MKIEDFAVVSLVVSRLRRVGPSGIADPSRQAKSGRNIGERLGGVDREKK